MSDEATKKRLDIAEASGKKKTVGQVALEEMQKTPDPDASIIDYQREAQKEYIQNLEECVKKHVKLIDGDFFVVVDTKREKILENVLRNYFYARKTCPTPNYDQSVFKYHVDSGDLEYIWTVPSKDTCLHLLDNALNLDLEEKELLTMVQAFADGTLMSMCKTFNNEEPDSTNIKKVRSVYAQS